MLAPQRPTGVTATHGDHAMNATPGGEVDLPP